MQNSDGKTSWVRSFAGTERPKDIVSGRDVGRIGDPWNGIRILFFAGFCN